MWNDLWRDIAENHRGKVLGALCGLVFALLMLRFGFFQALFIALLVLVGFLIGKRLDETKEDLWDLLDRLLPPSRKQR